jgi:Ca2+/Na+ antiporter
MILNVWGTHIIFASKSPIVKANTCGTSLWIIQIFIVHILQMLKFVHMVYDVFVSYLQRVHISMGLVFIMCTYAYTFFIFKYVHVQGQFNHLHENRYS